MKVWIVTYHFHPVWAGPAERFLRYYPGLSARGLKVEYITAARPGLPDTEMLNGAPVRRVAASPDGTPASVREFVDAAAAAALEDAHRPDVFVVLLADWMNARSIRALNRAGVKTVYVNTMVHGRSNASFRLKRWLSDYFNERLMKAYRHIVCSTRALEAPLREIGIPATRLHTISNGVSLARFRPAADEAEKSAIRKRVGLPEGVPLALFVGLIVDRKGVLDLIHAWRKVIAQLPDAHLVLVGDEQRQNPAFREFYAEWDDLMRSVTSADHILQHPPSREVEQYFKAADAFVFLSKEEGMPNVLTEAMASGLPVITTRFKGFSDCWGEAGKEFLLVERDHHRIAEALVGVLGDKGAAARLSANGLAYIREHHALETSLDQYARLFANHR